MRYVEARCHEADRDEAYRIYVTEALRGLAAMNIDYLELLAPAPTETRSAKEIITGISAKLDALGGEK